MNPFINPNPNISAEITPVENPMHIAGSSPLGGQEVISPFLTRLHEVGVGPSHPLPLPLDLTESAVEAGEILAGPVTENPVLPVSLRNPVGTFHPNFSRLGGIPYPPVMTPLSNLYQNPLIPAEMPPVDPRSLGATPFAMRGGILGQIQLLMHDALMSQGQQLLVRAQAHLAEGNRLTAAARNLVHVNPGVASTSSLYIVASTSSLYIVEPHGSGVLDDRDFLLYWSLVHRAHQAYQLAEAAAAEHRSILRDAASIRNTLAPTRVEPLVERLPRSVADPLLEPLLEPVVEPVMAPTYRTLEEPAVEPVEQAFTENTTTPSGVRAPWFFPRFFFNLLTTVMSTVISTVMNITVVIARPFAWGTKTKKTNINE